MTDLLEILIVEDDQAIQSLVVEALSDGGFEPAIASSGEEALTMLSGAESIYGMLVIDIKLGQRSHSRVGCCPPRQSHQVNIARHLHHRCRPR